MCTYLQLRKNIRAEITNSYTNGLDIKYNNLLLNNINAVKSKTIEKGTFLKYLSITSLISFTVKIDPKTRKIKVPTDSDKYIPVNKFIGNNRTNAGTIP